MPNAEVDLFHTQSETLCTQTHAKITTDWNPTSHLSLLCNSLCICASVHQQAGTHSCFYETVGEQLRYACVFADFIPRVFAVVVSPSH